MQVADIGIHSLSVTHQRYQVLDFIPFDVDPKDILVPKVIEGSFACAQPFLSEVYIPFKIRLNVLHPRAK